MRDFGALAPKQHVCTKTPIQTSNIYAEKEVIALSVSKMGNDSTETVSSRQNRPGNSEPTKIVSANKSCICCISFFKAPLKKHSISIHKRK